MVFGFLVHSILHNPHLLNLPSLLQQFQTHSNFGPPGTPSSSSTAANPSKIPVTPSKISFGQTIAASPVAASITASAANLLPLFNQTALFTAPPPTTNSVAHSILSEPEFTFNGTVLTPSQVGIAGSPPENVTVYLSQYFDNFDGNTPIAETLSQAIATQASIHFYQRKQMQMGAVNYDESRKKGKMNPATPSATNLDSVWASPALTMAGDHLPVVDGIFDIPANDVTQQPMQIVWRQFESCIFTLICYENENTLQALNLLQHLPKILADQYKNAQICSLPRELMARPEEMLAVLHTYLPKGLLQLIPNSLSKQLKREYEMLSQ